MEYLFQFKFAIAFIMFFGALIMSYQIHLVEKRNYDAKEVFYLIIRNLLFYLALGMVCLLIAIPSFFSTIDQKTVTELNTMDHFLIKYKEKELMDFFGALRWISFFSALVFLNVGMYLVKILKKMQ